MTGPAEVRRWIRRHRIAANGRVDPGTVYAVGLALVMAFALFGRPVVALIWPASAPPVGPVPALPAAAVALVFAAFFWVLRQIGPLSVSRSDATWLLPAPVSRRSLLRPALGLLVAAALVVGALTGLAVAGRFAQQPLPALAMPTGIVAGCAAALLVAGSAIACQRRPAWGRMADRVAGTLAAAALLFAVGGGTVIAPVGPGPESLGLAATALAAAISAMLLAYARLNGWPTHRIVEASALAGAYADVVYAVEPAFLTDLSSRRFWRRRGGFAPTGLFRRHRRAAVLIHDLLVARRKAGRFWWLAGTATVPMVLAGAPGWVVMAVVLVGALGAAGTLTEATHVDSANAAMLRLLGLSGRRVMAQRLVVPSLIASAWLALALAGLQADGRIGGPWWVLGVVAGPAVAVAALHRARVSAVSVGNVLIDTPLGAFPRACCCGSPTASTCWRC